MMKIAFSLRHLRRIKTLRPPMTLTIQNGILQKRFLHQHRQDKRRIYFSTLMTSLWKNDIPDVHVRSRVTMKTKSTNDLDWRLMRMIYKLMNISNQRKVEILIIINHVKHFSFTSKFNNVLSYIIYTLSFF